ncbi:hypothetical protein VP01_683g2 [Puccinia sorghi]|uniref:DDE Tnp4 domain-containing protein n=1 Tax=Puccinia sorghi TaxID=27349 RepID=A0A0L6UED2_9BASI|nr:hypothetical protein VP01_683g2 [Puccinia sorghi]
MHISQQPEKFFDQNQFLLVDSAYTSDQYISLSREGILDYFNVNFNYNLAQSQWIISCVVLHNLLADLKDQWNELYSAPVAQDDIYNSNEGMSSHLPTTASCISGIPR